MSYHRFLSWDCANKTLAHAYITVDGGILQKMRAYINTLQELSASGVDKGDNANNLYVSAVKIIEQIREILDKFIVFHSVAVTDILEGAKVDDKDEVERSKMLRKFLHSSGVSCEKIELGTKLLIEHQPSKIGTATNNKSTMIGHQLMFYYGEYEVNLISPKVKNTLWVDPTRKLDHYVGSCASEYYARKKHSKEMFLTIITAFGWEGVIKGIPKSCMDDLADAVMQTIAFMKTKRMFI